LTTLEFTAGSGGRSTVLRSILAALMTLMLAWASMGLRALLRLSALCAGALGLALGLGSTAMASTSTTPTASAPSSIVAGGLVRSTIHIGWYLYLLFPRLKAGRPVVVLTKLSAFRNRLGRDYGRKQLFFFPVKAGFHGSDLAYQPSWER
jgi:hypothetical protein